MEEKESNWSAFVPKGWWDNAEIAGFRFRLFTSTQVLLYEDKTCRKVANIIEKAINHRICLWFFEITKETKIEHFKCLVGFSEGNYKAFLADDLIKLPPGGYCLLISSFEHVADGGTREVECDEALEKSRGLLCAILGGSVANDHAVTFSISNDEKRLISSNSQFLNLPPMPQDYMFIGQEALVKLESYFDAETDPLWKSRAESAFFFIGISRTANDARHRFFNLWTGLEVYLGGSRGVSGLIQKKVKIKKWHQIMKKLKDKRDDMIHQGIRHGIDVEEERYICATIINAICERAKIEDDELSYIMNN